MVLPPTSRTSGGVELSVVIPSFNERSNVGLLITRLEEALRDIEWEAIYVDDDSPDGTADEVRALSATNRRVRCVHRIGRRGLSSAVIEGILWRRRSAVPAQIGPRRRGSDGTALR